MCARVLVLWYFFQALSAVESEDLVQEERARKAAVRKSRMESDLDAESADLQEKKGVGSARRGWLLESSLGMNLKLMGSRITET